jgi:D-serine deaminase-like pyridoxal phosphate-dependent protein
MSFAKTDSPYRVEDLSRVFSPSLLLFRELLEKNVDAMIGIAGSAGRLRPHCKTHKMAEVTRLELSKGIHKHKCATFAEAQMLAEAGATDVFLAYNVVGPNLERAVEFVKRFPDVVFSVTADDLRPIAALSERLSATGRTIDVLLDIDIGFHRTGIVPGDAAVDLYRQIAKSPGLRPGGLHAYDGQVHQPSRDEREQAVEVEWQTVRAFRDRLVREGLPVPRIIVGGTPTFPIHARNTDPAVELAPGTCVLNDAGYDESYADMKFTPAAVLLTRVVSRPAANRLTLDAGTKSVATDPPVGRRLVFPDLPESTQVIHNEEHLVLETPGASEFAPGDAILAIPRHICPTVALHKDVSVVSAGRVVDRWAVTARDRFLGL